MDLVVVTASLREFIRRHNAQFDRLTDSESQMLEIGALALTAEHYRHRGYTVGVENRFGGRFKLKLSARGYPFNFSWFSVTKDEQQYEIHGNLPVQSAYRLDEGVYVVDVGVVIGGRVPTRTRPQENWRAVDNEAIITFIEAKKLVIYPMLLAQFVGIVHEIVPRVLGDDPCFEAPGHFYPALVSIGYLHGTAESIREGYRNRRYYLNIVPTFDTIVSQLSRNPEAESPFEPRLPQTNDLRPALEVAAFANGDGALAAVVADPAVPAEATHAAGILDEDARD